MTAGKEKYYKTDPTQFDTQTHTDTPLFITFPWYSFIEVMENINMNIFLSMNIYL